MRFFIPSDGCGLSTIIISFAVWLSWSLFQPSIVVLSAPVITPCVGKFNASEFNALHKIYDSLNGPQWIVRIGQPWNFTNPNVNPCNSLWGFILCNSRCRVKSLRFITVSGMIGSIPDVFRELPYIQDLTIAQNPRIGGPIPPSIGSLINLQSLNLANNLFEGSLPATLGNLQRLQRLDLREIGLVGPFVPSLWSVSSMESLQIGNNLFTGTIPPSVSNMVNLTLFDISNNRFYGTLVPSMGDWQKLVQFDANHNSLTGSLSSFICNWKNITSFNVGSNRLRGTIPSCIGNWTQIQSIFIGANLFTGELPSIDYGIFTKIKGFDCDTNRLGGRLPPEFYNMTSINNLVLARNQFSGTIDRSISNLQNLVFFDIAKNNFTGSFPTMQSKHLAGLTIKLNKFSSSIPYSLAVNCPNLREFYADFNQLTGEVPASMWNLTSLQLLNIASNKFHGIIPDFINVTMPSLSVFEISNNSFYGPFPVAVLSMPLLTTFDIHANLFTGTLPDDFGYIAGSLLYVDMSLNLLHGTVPHSIARLDSVAIFSVGHNMLSSTLPALYNMTSLSYGFFYNNMFTGFIPAPFYYLKSFLGFNNLFTSSIPIDVGANLRVFNIDNNIITGSLPTDAEWWRKITVLSAANNSLTGTLSANVSSGKVLQFFDVSTNDLHGSIKDHFINHVALNKLYLQNNRFSGNIENILNPEVHHVLSSFDISANGFSGTIPPSLFHLRRLSEFAAVKNCFSGSIPDDVCFANATLSSLAIDGLYTSELCTNKIFPRIPSMKSYLLLHPLQGTIPSCLFENFSLLTTLHAAGNGLEGNFLSKLKSISPKLIDLSLSHNKLEGSISLAIQRHKWQSLDLSFNKFGGVIDHDVFNFGQSSGNSVDNVTNYAVSVDAASGIGGGGASSSTWPALYLDINRLSGHIPASLRNAHNISILSGNIFSCDINKAQLPSHDPNKVSYECGSNSINIALYVWIALSVCLFTVVAIVLGLTNVCCSSIFKKDEENVSGLFSQIKVLVQSYWEVYELLDGISLSASPSSNNEKNGSNETNIPEDDSAMPSLQVKTSDDTEQRKREADNNRILAFRDIGLLLPTARRWATWITIILMFYGMIVYPILNNFYGRYTYPYAWVLSACYLTGFVPTAVIMSLLIALAFAIYSELDILFYRLSWGVYVNVLNVRSFQSEVMKLRMFQENRNNIDKAQISSEKVVKNDINNETAIAIATTIPGTENGSTTGGVTSLWMDSSFSVDTKRVETTGTIFETQDNHTHNRWKFKVTWYLVVGLVVVLDAIIVLIVNMLYVSIINDSSVNARGKQIIAIATSIYKLVWNSIMFKIFKQVRLQAKLTHYFPVSSRAYTEEEEAFSKLLGSCMTALSLFNSIIAPCIAVALVSSDCFLYVLSSAPSIQVTYQSQPCRALLLQEEIPQQLECHGDIETYSTTFAPPFIYAYQCSSQLLVTFAEVFVYRYIIGGMIVPCIQIYLKLCQGYIFRRFGKDSFAWWLLNRFLMKVLQPMMLSPSPAMSDKRVYENGLDVEKDPLRESSTSGQNNTINKTAIDKTWFRAERNLNYIATDMAIMLTFGTMFPPLALVGCISVFFYTTFLQLSLGRIYSLARTDPENFQYYVDSIRDEWKGMSKWIVNAFHTTRPLVLIFWSFFLFDIYGDRYGSYQAAWIFLIMGAVPIMIMISNGMVKRWLKYCEDRDRERKMSILSHSIEMLKPDEIVGGRSSLVMNSEESMQRESVDNPLVFSRQ